MVSWLRRTLRKVFATRPKHHPRPDISDLIQSPFEVMKELERRRADPSIRARVEEILGGDVPDYVRGEPILYLSRHIVTPNYETIRFIHLMEGLGLKTVISQDSRGLFVSQNLIKRALCKLPVCIRITQKEGKINEQYQNVTVADFSKIDGKRFCEIKTMWGEPLIDFHTRLFKELRIHSIDMPDDADWIDRHGRGDLLKQYKDQLLLFVTHGIFFENYNLDDEHEIEFIYEILRPACDYVEKMVGLRPLIAPIFPSESESYNFWISYPTDVMKAVRESMKLNQRTHHKKI